MGLCLNLCLESFSPTGNQRTKRLAKELRNFPMRRFRVRWLDTALDGRQLDAGPAETAIDRDGRVKPRPGKNGARRLSDFMLRLLCKYQSSSDRFLGHRTRNPTIHHSTTPIPNPPLLFPNFGRSYIPSKILLNHGQTRSLQRPTALNHLLLAISRQREYLLTLTLDFNRESASPLPADSRLKSGGVPEFDLEQE